MVSDKIEEQFKQLIEFTQHIRPAEVEELQLEFELLGDRAYLHAKHLNKGVEAPKDISESRASGNGSPHHITVER